MHNQEIHRQWQVLQSLITKSSAASAADIELQAHWAKYICVLSAGLIENALKEIYGKYTRTNTSEPIANFVIDKLSIIRNPKTERFLYIAGSFKPSWKVDLEAFVNIDGRGDAIDSIMNNRHLIAHGKNSNITLHDIKIYLRKSYEVMEFVEKQCMT